MKRAALETLMVAVLASAAVAQEGVRTARLGASHGAAGGLSEATAALDRAAAARKFAIVFFWKDQNPQTGRAWSTLQTAAGRMSDWAEIVPVQASNPAEKALVDRFGTSRAPMPLVLAVAPCGAVTKAFGAVFDEAQLRTAFVSPGTQLCLKALQDRKLVLLCVFDQAESAGTALPPGVRDFKADARFDAASEVVLINANDDGEAGFLKELKVDARAPKPFTVLLAPPGTVVGQFDNRASKDQLVAKLTASQSDPCAGGACGPGGCGPRR
jgi:hypothetical protein